MRNARLVSFHIDQGGVPRVLERLERDLVPAYRQLEGFGGLLVLESLERTDPRSHLLGISLWADDAAFSASEAVSDAMGQQAAGQAGPAVTRSRYVVRLLEKGASGPNLG